VTLQSRKRAQETKTERICVEVHDRDAKQRGERRIQEGKNIKSNSISRKKKNENFTNIQELSHRGSPFKRGTIEVITERGVILDA